MSEYLLEKLKKYGRSDCYPLHMPGHKRRTSHFTHPFEIDITEIDGFDNLHHAEGVLLEAQQRAARLYGADETFYLINGSTCGILAAVAASAKRGERILMARNCHKAAYHAVFLNGLQTSYVYPSVDTVRGISGSISPDAVGKALAEQHDIRAVLITSPTYDGVVSDIHRIAQEVHRFGAILIVDEAHGAHFAMHPYFPESALSCGADIVINSLHKTMPSLTQTALLHVRGKRADRERLRKYLGIYQSSSPSYVLMAGMDACIAMMQSQRGTLFEAFTERLESARQKLHRLRRLHLVDGTEDGLNVFGFDKSKLLISTERAGISGTKLSDILREEHHLETEMQAERYVTALMTVCDEREGFDRLIRALLEVDHRLAGRMQRPEDSLNGNVQKGGRLSGEVQKIEDSGIQGCHDVAQILKNQEVLTIEEAENSPSERILLLNSGGRISAEFVYVYPPGIPLLAPGERISKELLEQLACIQNAGLKLQGIADYSGQYILVVKQAGQGCD